VPARGLVVDLGVQGFGPIEAECPERKNEAEPGADAVPQVTQSKFTGGGEDIARVPIDAPVKQLVDRKA